MSSAKRFAALILIVVLLLSAVSCGKNVPEETEPVTEPETTEIQKIRLVDAGKAVYSVIRQDGSPDLVVKGATLIATALKKSAPGLLYDVDWERADVAASDEVAERYEILIGDTKRPQSKAALEGLGYDDWVIRTDGRKLVVNGGNEFAIYLACEKLVALFTASDDKSVEIDSLSLNGKAYDAESRMILLCDQKQGAVEIFRIFESGYTTEAVRKIRYSENNIADARLRSYKGKDVIMAAYGNNSASMRDYESGDVIWITADAPSNPHACELIPLDNGFVIGVAGSNGSEVRFFNMDGNSSKYASVPLYDAHGVLWDPDLKLVWCLGEDGLFACEVKILDDGSVSVTEKEGMRYALPTKWSHDLQPVYGNRDRLWITTVTGVYQFSKSEGVFHSDYPGAESISVPNVKGVGNFEDGTAVFLYPDGKLYDWTSESFNAYLTVEGSEYCINFKVNGSGSYKIRPFIADYN